MLYLSFTLYLIRASYALAGRSGMDQSRAVKQPREEWGMGDGSDEREEVIFLMHL